ncbi:MAG: hypothetical protein K6F87_03930 [Lachnospiraceae bacterium]|nr:hypothetical protein [Lachnospiraceae bacterium]
MKISKLFVSQKTEIYLRQLYPKQEAEKRIRILGKERMSGSAVIMALTVIISVFVFAAGQNEKSNPIAAVKRNDEGAGSRTMTLFAVTDDGKKETVTVEINERKYSKDELIKFSEDLGIRLQKEILGKNDDPENIRYDLDLKDRIEGFPFKISYKSDRPLILDGRGVIDIKRQKKDDPEDEGIPVRIVATLEYEDYSEDLYFYVIVHQKNEDDEGFSAENIKALIETADNESKNESVQKLPGNLKGKKITFYDASPNKGWIVVLTGTVAVLLLMATSDRKIKDEAERRKRQMDKDYPKILVRYALYYIAGMNPRTIWAKICSDYESGQDNPKAGKRYAYEEMLLAKKRMDEGCGELKAYDEFAERCDDIRFRSFSGFVKQAVISGNDDLSDILIREMEKAQKENIDLIKNRACEAETKMLLPMFLVLADILAIVMIPAFIGLKV